MKESDLEKYEKIKTNLYATVKFVSEIISVKKDKEDILEQTSVITHKIVQLFVVIVTYNSMLAISAILSVIDMVNNNDSGKIFAWDKKEICY